MINNERIIPVQKIDLLSLLGTTMTLAGVSYGVVEAADVEGNFTVTGSGDAGKKLCNAPVKSINLASGVTAAVVYFVAGYNYEGIKVNGTAVTPEEGSATVNKDGVSLYSATLSSGDVTIAAVTPAV